MNKNYKNGLKGILGFVFWFFIAQYSDVLFTIMGININNWSTISKMIFSISTEILSVYIIYKLFEDDINKMIIDFKINNIDYFNKYFRYWFLVLILMFACNFFIVLLDPTSTANNQDLIVNMFKNHPAYTFLLSVIFAPIIEELVFRLCFKNIFNNKYFFILMSGLVFGLFHVVGSFETAFDFLYVIPYSVPGIIFAYVYIKSKNIFVPMWLHFVHNGTIMVVQMLLVLYGN